MIEAEPESNTSDSTNSAVRRPRHRGIYLLPNLFTTAGLFAGFYSIVAAIGGRFEPAAMAIFIAMVMDGMDGRIARMTNTQSDFGKEYDSLVDMVCFGLAPALVVFTWSLHNLGKVGWVAAFLYAAATALRLARFNTQVPSFGKRYFQGLASPAAAALVAGLIWSADNAGFTGADMPKTALVITVLAALLMVSNFRYRSFKDIDFKGKIPFMTVIVIVLTFVAISVHPPVMLFAVFGAYALSGPMLTLITLRQRRRARKTSGEFPPD